MTRPKIVEQNRASIMARLADTNERLDHLIVEIGALTEATRIIDARIDYVADIIQGGARTVAP